MSSDSSYIVEKHNINDNHMAIVYRLLVRVDTEKIQIVLHYELCVLFFHEFYELSARALKFIEILHPAFHYILPGQNFVTVLDI